MRNTIYITLKLFFFKSVSSSKRSGPDTIIQHGYYSENGWHLYRIRILKSMNIYLFFLTSIQLQRNHLNFLSLYLCLIRTTLYESLLVDENRYYQTMQLIRRTIKISSTFQISLSYFKICSTWSSLYDLHYINLYVLNFMWKQLLL